MVLADDRHIVLGLTGDDAGVATGAGIEIYCHAPLFLRGQLGVGVERNILRDMTIHAHRLGKGMIFFVALDGAFAHEIAAFHALVLLRLRNRVVAVGDFAGHAAEGAHAVRAAERVGIETHTIHQGGDFLASIPQGDGKRVVGVAWSDNRRGFDGGRAIGNFHDVGDQVVVDVVAQFLGDVSENIEVICLDAEF